MPTNAVSLKFIILTEEISFIPDNIINCCQTIRVPRPSRSLYNRCLKNKVDKNISLDKITNMKNIMASVTQLMIPYEVICNNLIDEIINIHDMRFINMRDQLYDIFIYNLDVTECIWYILVKLVKMNKLQEKDMTDILIKTFSFLQYYNNNYRPIYHLESYIFYLSKKVHGFS